MSISFKGESFGIVIAGDRGHNFMLPADPTTMPPKISEAFNAALDAQKNEQTVDRRKSSDHQAKADAREGTRQALNNLYDVAAASASSRRDFHQEGYALAALKLGRALAEAEAAIQTLACHAQQNANPSGVGINPTQSNKTIATLRAIADDLATLTPVPALDA
ncbi:hypothetical protein AB0J30_08865 [Streptomyces microflavus]|uniref:hypothetical protein n=1 Tax=Streptomyces microflavus TaxID=1919 RepID=UPI0034454005